MSDDLDQFARRQGMTPVKHFPVLHPGWECDNHGTRKQAIQTLSNLYTIQSV
jgi:hypothetical protein